MKIKENVTIYQCEHCKKKLFVKSAMVRHEFGCTYNPANFAACLNCRFCKDEPREFYDAITMERNAADNLTTIKGLGRDFSWWDLIVAYRYLGLVKRHKSAGYIPG